MDRTKLIELLKEYKTSFPEEETFIPRFISLLTNFHTCFSRSLTTGHMTASAWIVSRKGDKALLVHHKKLNKWLQPGGHADGMENLRKVAMKEAVEETGLKSLMYKGNGIFDIDIHMIPDHKQIPAHFHYDIRFLLVADGNETPAVSDESHEVRWIFMEKIPFYTKGNRSIERMIRKAKLIFK